MIQLTVNEQPLTFEGDPHMPLLWFLRDEAGLTGTEVADASRAAALKGMAQVKSPAELMKLHKLKKTEARFDHFVPLSPAAVRHERRLPVPGAAWWRLRPRPCPPGHWPGLKIRSLRAGGAPAP